MNESIDLTKVLKNCPGNTKLYSSVYGEVLFRNINENNVNYPVIVYSPFYDSVITFTREGRYDTRLNGECILFPSKDQRDWNKFTAPWYKKDVFDPSTLKPFDKVLVQISRDDIWSVDFFSYYNDEYKKCICTGLVHYFYCIPYNDETKDLVGTCNEAPDYYKWW